MSNHCKFVATDRPRVLPGRHNEDCAGDCAGCLACPMDHCRVCGVEHSTGACPGCLAEAREGLAEIVRMYAALPEEVEHRGIEGEAMALLGPAADPEAWGHVEASVASGRLPKDWQVELGQHHPLTVLASWQDVYADAFDQQVTRRATVLEAAAWLNGQLTRAGEEAWVPFDEFARDVRQCATHLERVLHDGEQVDRTRVTCTNELCLKRPRLECRYAWGDKPDQWACPNCAKTYTDGEFRNAHAKQLRHEGAKKFLPFRDAVSTLVAQGRPERTIRKWMKPPDPEKDDLDTAEIVGGFCELGSHRVLVWWPDLWRLHLTTPTRKRVAA